ncbi:alternate-type signal peptide domain-containing protein [Plantibacter sp. VKM Ac-2880]|uniref:alternate-type signal peptide domain-containing protein n=1 Tax=Plantibacter sp. VKM Ac-2880 TaxID=2783827 RepID=UPI00188FD282|nr:alternate-type signal peptide domain-containing protein [Plantibacter sp. VKM Ac-2880]MBF4570074.1 alternate-type signal peptide domain-containing protein [Plantibacter sp. VKM Ac-2880]
MNATTATAVKSSSTKKVAIAAIAGGVGVALLLGGAGTLAYWTDNAATSQEIQTGSLALGTITDAWSIKNGAGAAQSFTGPIVPGDVLTTTVSVPVDVTGQNMNAKLDVTDAIVDGDATLEGALQVKVVSVNGIAGSTATTTQDATVPVVISVTFPFGTTGQYNDAEVAKAVFSAKYTLTQVPAAS